MMHNFEYKELTNWDELWHIIESHVAFQLLWSATELDLFTLLSEQPDSNIESISKKLELEIRPTQILLWGLTTLGLLKKQDERYSNAMVAEKHLVKDKPDCQIPVLGWQYHIVYPGLMNFVDCLRQNKNLGLEFFPGEGETLYERMASNPQLEKVFQNALSSLSKSANQAMVNSGRFEGIRHLVDLGGGDGTNAIALVRKHPEMKVTIFDHPSVCEIADQNIRDHGLQQNIHLHPGDIVNDKMPSGIDGALFCHMFTIFSADKNVGLLKKCYSALPNSGKVFIYNMVSNDDGIGPRACSLGSPYFLAIASGEGMLYPGKDYQDWFTAAGFPDVWLERGFPLNHQLSIGLKRVH